MYQKKQYHFIGICGIGMSGIAKILLQQGIPVSGCDLTLDPQRTQELEKLGAVISTHQGHACSSPSITTVVRSSDVPLTHPEILQAIQKNISILHRAQILAMLMQKKTGITISGAHGKTTTTALLAHVLSAAQLHPSIMVGGHIHSMNSNAVHGSGNFMVCEADESDRSFLMLPKKYNITTNIDREHLNTYQDFDDIKQTFIQFLNQIPTDGLNILCLDNPGIQSILAQLDKPYVTYGTHPDATYRIKNIQLFPDYSEFELLNNDSNLGVFKVQLPGMHNVLNATAVIALSLHLEICKTAIKNALESFQGVDRRFTFKGISKCRGALIYDDYGHHPTELEATILIARKKAQGKVIMVFQPQRFSRTKHLWNEFVQIFAQADLDHVIITDIFTANEPEELGINSQRLVDCIQAKNPKAQIYYIPWDQKGSAILSKLDEILKPSDLVLFQGAGKVNKLAADLLKD